jgi:hypothetical protein
VCDVLVRRLVCPIEDKRVVHSCTNKNVRCTSLEDLCSKTGAVSVLLSLSSEFVFCVQASPQRTEKSFPNSGHNQPFVLLQCSTESTKIKHTVSSVPTCSKIMTLLHSATIRVPCVSQTCRVPDNQYHGHGDRGYLLLETTTVSITRPRAGQQAIKPVTTRCYLQYPTI